MVARVRAFIGWASGTIPVRLVQRLVEDDGPNWATVVAWNALTAVFPIALALIAIVGFALSRAGIDQSVVVHEITVLFPSDQATQMAAIEAISNVRKSSLLFGLLALVGYLWTASNLFGALEAAFEAVYHCGRRDFVPQKLMALWMMAIFCVLAALAVGTSALLPLVNTVPDVPTWLKRGLTFPIQVGIGVVSGFVLFFGIYYVVPNRRRRAREVWPGALLAGIGFEALTLLFPTYIKLNPGINQFGKAFALLFVLVAFFFFFGLITMLGAELNAVLSEPGARRADQQPALPRPGVVPVHGGPPRGLRRALFAALGVAIGLLAALRQPASQR